MVFFQAMLLAGYLYAHASTRWLRFQHQAVLHIVLLAASFLALPIVVAAQHSEPPATGMPIGWLLRVLLVTVGIPFFLVSSSGPLLQRWFARTDHPRARDPYFLSVAGNIGSIFALLAYPALLEPSLRLAEQSSIWTGGYIALVLLTAACFYLAYRQSSAHRALRRARIGRDTRRAGRRAGLAQRASLDCAVVRALQPAARGHDISHDRRSGGAAPVDRAARHLSADLRAGLRAARARAACADDAHAAAVGAAARLADRVRHESSRRHSGADSSAHVLSCGHGVPRRAGASGAPTAAT